MKTLFLLATLVLASVGLVGCGQSGSNANSMNHNSMMKNSNSSMNMNGMDHNSMPMNSNMSMSHSEMKSSPNAASQPYDLQFIDTMTVHHQGAVDMAKMALTKSQNAELKTFAQKLIDDQNKEITQMKEWRGKWYAGKPAATNMEMPGMGDSMKMMNSDGMRRMEAAMGKDLDIHFLDMMIPHHAGATVMAKEARTKAEHTELKTLANQIIKEQEAEIKLMTEWKAKWGNK